MLGLVPRLRLRLVMGLMMGEEEGEGEGGEGTLLLRRGGGAGAVRKAEGPRDGFEVLLPSYMNGVKGKAGR